MYQHTEVPTLQPTKLPMIYPTSAPSTDPTVAPTRDPSMTSTAYHSKLPTKRPTLLIGTSIVPTEFEKELAQTDVVHNTTLADENDNNEERKPEDNKGMLMILVIVMVLVSFLFIVCGMLVYIHSKKRAHRNQIVDNTDISPALPVNDVSAVALNQMNISHELVESDSNREFTIEGDDELLTPNMRNNVQMNCDLVDEIEISSSSSSDENGTLTNGTISRINCMKESDILTPLGDEGVADRDVDDIIMIQQK